MMIYPLHEAMYVMKVELVTKGQDNIRRVQEKQG